MAEASEHCNLNTDGIDDLMMLKTSKLQESAGFGDVARGEITAFTANGEALDEKDLARCNGN